MSGEGAASYGDLLITSLVVLGGVCVAAFVAVRVLGRLLATGRGRGARMLDVVARMPLEPRRSLYVVDVAGKVLLVGTSEMGLSVLTELDAGEVRARSEVARRPTFAELVSTAWARRRKPPNAPAATSTNEGMEAPRPAEPPEPARDIAAVRTNEAAEAPRPAKLVEPARDREDT